MCISPSFDIDSKLSSIEREMPSQLIGSSESLWDLSMSPQIAKFSNKSFHWAPLPEEAICEEGSDILKTKEVITDKNNIEYIPIARWGIQGFVSEENHRKEIQKVAVLGYLWKNKEVKLILKYIVSILFNYENFLCHTVCNVLFL